MRFIQQLQSKIALQSLESSSKAITRWFNSPLGQALLAQEEAHLAEELSCLFGYHLMQLSSVQGAQLYDASTIHHCFNLTSDPKDSSAQGVSDFGSLPIGDETVDVTLLHHVLEFSPNPHQVLKEAARVTIPKGYIIIVGFNPFSLSGLVQPIRALFGGGAIHKRRTLRSGRIEDWLQFLDFNITNQGKLFHKLPINNRHFHSTSPRSAARGFRKWLPGMAFIIVARKDKVGLTPIRPTWETKRLLDGMPIKQAIRNRSSEVAREATILPFRTRH